MRFAAGSATLCSLLFNFGKQPDRQAFNIQHSTFNAQHPTPNTEQRIVPIVNHCGPGEPGVGQTFQSAGSRNFPVPCFQLRAIGQVRMRAAARMNGRLESRPTGRLESLPYKSERLAFSCGCLFPHLPSWPCAAAGAAVVRENRVKNHCSAIHTSVPTGRRSKRYSRSASARWMQPHEAGSPMDSWSAVPWM